MRSEFPSVVEALRARAVESADRTAFRFLLNGEHETVRMSYAALDERARSFAVCLGQLGAAGQPVLLAVPPGLDFVAALFGCLYGGAVAVPCYPPSFRPSDRAAAHLAALAHDCGAPIGITVEAHLPRTRQFTQQVAGMRPPRWLAADSVPVELAGEWTPPEIGPDTLALVQYTSGSTRSPRGVKITHACLAANQRAMAEKIGRVDETVSWLPPYHDMGLMCIVHGVWSGFAITLMAPMDFLARPVRWLRAISRYRADTSLGPNFAYEMCVDRIGDEECEGLDLSCWQRAFSSAEPVRARTIERFSRKFAPFGFRREAFYPAYGLAEATLIVTAKPHGTAPRVLGCDPEQLQRGRAVTNADENATGLVSSGTPAGSYELAIVDPESGLQRDHGEIGEIWIAGPSVDGR
jgi:acyl-CoA synthetase (AMP-forming)/AMP-acid ligase II